MLAVHCHSCIAKARTEALVNDIEDEQVKVQASTEDGTVTAHLRISAARLALKVDAQPKLDLSGRSEKDTRGASRELWYVRTLFKSSHSGNPIRRSRLENRGSPCNTLNSGRDFTRVSSPSLSV